MYYLSLTFFFLLPPHTQIGTVPHLDPISVNDNPCEHTWDGMVQSSPVHPIFSQSWETAGCSHIWFTSPCIATHTFDNLILTALHFFTIAITHSSLTPRSFFQVSPKKLSPITLTPDRADTPHREERSGSHYCAILTLSSSKADTFYTLFSPDTCTWDSSCNPHHSLFKIFGFMWVG